MVRALVIGSDHLGLRMVEQLLADGVEVAVIAPTGYWLATAPLPAGVTRSIGDAESAEVLSAAGIAESDALFAVSDVDELNLGVAMAARELCPSIRIVLRQFNLRLGALVAKHMRKCDVLSLSALAAETFAMAALTPYVVYACAGRQQTLVLREGPAAALIDPSRLHGMALLAAWQDGRPQWFPDPATVETDARVLVASGERDLPLYAPGKSSTRAPRHQRTASNRRLLWLTLAYLAFVIGGSSLFFGVTMGLAPLDAVYFVVTMVTSVGFGDFNLQKADAVSKVVGILVMLSGVMTTAVLFALVTNELVDRQIAINRGQRRMRVRNHVVVCGLGVVGYRVARALRSRGLSVVVVERDPDGRFVGQARADGMAVVIGDATQEKALDFANLQEARSLVAVTNQDYRNLEIALLARSYSQELPVVLRLFDPSKQRRVAGLFCLETTFSSAALAAARFAASAAVPTRIARCAFGESVYDLHRVEVKAGENGVTAAAGINSVPICYEDGDGELHFGGFDQAPVGALVYAIKRQ